MLEQLNTFFKKIFNNEETIVFSFALLFFFYSYFFFWISFNTIYDKCSCCIFISWSSEKNSVL